MEAIAWKELLVVTLPVIGAILKKIPKINNQLIPYILTIIAAVKNYWIMAGLPTELAADPTGLAPTIMAAGFLGDIGQFVVPLFWGAAESWISTRIHKSFKYRAIAKGQRPPAWT